MQCILRRILYEFHGINVAGTTGAPRNTPGTESTS
jgi:hypothetical protein